MSYDCYLKDPVTGETLTADNSHNIIGPICAVDVNDYSYCRDLWLNITFNYAKHFNRVMPGGVVGLDGKTGAESIPILEKGIAQLGDETDDDYWKPTEGNAKRALYGLLELARMCPDGVWEISK